MGTNVSEEDVSWKINVQSPGPIEVIGGLTVFIIAVTGYVLSGGKVNFEHTPQSTSGSMETEGLLTKITEFLDARHKRHVELCNGPTGQQIVDLTRRLDAKYPEALNVNDEAESGNSGGSEPGSSQ